MSDQMGGDGRGRLAVEFFVIIAGVLVALTAESWWSGREARAFERELLEDMVEEFRANISILDSDLAENAGALQRLQLITEMEPEELVAAPLAEMRAHFDVVANLWYAGFDPAMGAVRALVESGDLAVLSDRDLRLQLAEWAALLDERQRFTQNSTDFLLFHVTPRLAAMGRDGSWARFERTEAQALLRVHLAAMRQVIDNQEALRALAEEIVSYLVAQN